jgi:hypothetical protein
MWPYVLLLVGAIAIATLLSMVFIFEILALLFNFSLLYVVGTRIFYRYQRKQVNWYLFGAGLAALLVAMQVKIFPFWKITNFALMTAVFAELLDLIPKSFWKKVGLQIGHGVKKSYTKAKEKVKKSSKKRKSRKKVPPPPPVRPYY